jgi:hypothetical protein
MCAALCALYARTTQAGDPLTGIAPLVVVSLVLSGLAVGFKRNETLTAIMLQIGLASVSVLATIELANAGWRISLYIVPLIFAVTVLGPLTLRRYFAPLSDGEARPHRRRIVALVGLLGSVGQTLGCFLALALVSELVFEVLPTNLAQTMTYYPPAPPMSASIVPSLPPIDSSTVPPPPIPLDPSVSPASATSDGSQAPVVGVGPAPLP